MRIEPPFWNLLSEMLVELLSSQWELYSKYHWEQTNSITLRNLKWPEFERISTENLLLNANKIQNLTENNYSQEKEKKPKTTPTLQFLTMLCIFYKICMFVKKCSALETRRDACWLAWFLLVLLWSYAHLISNNIRNCLQCYEMHLFYIFKEIVYADILPKRHWFIEQLYRFMCSTFFSSFSFSLSVFASVFHGTGWIHCCWILNFIILLSETKSFLW